MKITIDIGGTQTRVATWDGNNLEIVKIFGTDKNNPEVTANEIVNLLSQYEVEKINILAPGPHTIDGTSFDNPPNLKGWHGFNIVKFFKDVYPVDVQLLNDARGAAIGESFLKDCDSLLFYTISTGFGSGCIVDGKAIKGNNNLGGEIFGTIVDNTFEPNILGEYLTIEQIVSGTWMFENAKKLGYDVNETKDLFVNDKYSDYLDYTSTKLAMYIYGASLVIDPKIIVLGGSVILKNDWYFEMVKNKLVKYGCKSEILTAEENGYSGLYSVCAVN